MTCLSIVQIMNLNGPYYKPTWLSMGHHLSVVGRIRNATLHQQHVGMNHHRLKFMCIFNHYITGRLEMMGSLFDDPLCQDHMFYLSLKHLCGFLLLTVMWHPIPLMLSHQSLVTTSYQFQGACVSTLGVCHWRSELQMLGVLLFWLVVELLWKILVHWDDYSQYMGK